MSTVQGTGGLGNMADSLGSLAQSARTKQLKSARGILLFVGILTVVVNLGFVIFAEQIVNSQIDKEVKEIRAKHMMIDEVKLAAIRDQAIRTTRLIDAIGAVLGVVFLTCAIFVYTYPIAATVTSLVLYLGAAAVYGVMDPTTLARGWWIKILIVVGLFKAVQAALAYENERKAAAASPMMAGSLPLPAGQAPLKL